MPLNIALPYKSTEYKNNVCIKQYVDQAQLLSLSSSFSSPRSCFVGRFYCISDVFPISFSDVTYNLSTWTDDWSRVRSVGSLLGASVVHFVRSVDTKHLH